jgi:hypothetical protein
MSFLMRSATPSREDRRCTLALEAWRMAEELVAERWKEYRSAGRETRAGAYAAYLGALDREAMAANELALVLVGFEQAA